VPCAFHWCLKNEKMKSTWFFPCDSPFYNPYPHITFSLRMAEEEEDTIVVCSHRMHPLGEAGRVNDECAMDVDPPTTCPPGGRRYGVKGFCYIGQRDGDRQTSLSPQEIDYFFERVRNGPRGTPRHILRPERMNELKRHKWMRLTESEISQFSMDHTRIGMPLDLKHEFTEGSRFPVSPLGRVTKLKAYPGSRLKFTAEVHPSKTQFVRPGMGASLSFGRSLKTGEVQPSHRQRAEISLVDTPFFPVPPVDLGGDALLTSSCGDGDGGRWFSGGGGYVTDVFELSDGKSGGSEYITPTEEGTEQELQRDAMSDEQESGSTPTTGNESVMDTTDDQVGDQQQQGQSAPSPVPKNARKTEKQKVIAQKKIARKKLDGGAAPTPPVAPKQVPTAGVGGQPSPPAPQKPQGASDPMLMKSREELILLNQRRRKRLEEVTKRDINANLDAYIEAAREQFGSSFDVDNMDKIMKFVQAYKTGLIDETTPEGRIAAMMAKNVEEKVQAGRVAQPRSMHAPAPKRSRTDTQTSGVRSTPRRDQEGFLSQHGHSPIRSRPRKVAPNGVHPVQIEASKARQEAERTGVAPDAMALAMARGRTGPGLESQLAEIKRQEQELAKRRQEIAGRLAAEAGIQKRPESRVPTVMRTGGAYAPPVAPQSSSASDIVADIEAVFGSEFGASLRGRIADRIGKSNEEYRVQLERGGGMGADMMGSRMPVNDEIVVLSHSRARESVGGYFTNRDEDNGVMGYDESDMEAMIGLQTYMRERHGGDIFRVDARKIMDRDQDRWGSLYDNVPDPRLEEGEKMRTVQVIRKDLIVWDPREARQVRDAQQMRGYARRAAQRRQHSMRGRAPVQRRQYPGW